MGNNEWVGQPAHNLPTPSLLINYRTLQGNVNKLHQDVQRLGIDFRPHVKTLKSIEVTRLMLAGGKYRKIIASTLAEIEGALPLVDEGLLDECLYGLPIYPGVLPRLVKLRERVRIVLMIDNEAHVDILEQFSSVSNSSPSQWQCFIKIDVGSHRAGVETHVPRLRSLIRRAESSAAVNVYGFYCHAGHSYACRDQASIEDVLRTEVDGVSTAASLMSENKPVVISVGATPTAHVVESLKASLPTHCSLELHAGNFPANDLQQVSTGLVDLTQQSIRVLAEVCSVYPERNEALVNSGVIALAREASAFPGFGAVVGKPLWGVVRVSQEHGIIGILKSQGDSPLTAGQVEQEFAIGDKVYLYCQHACITAAAFNRYFIVDEHDVVTDVWTPWKFW